ncbi:hypothetical protein IW150_004561, partial [Coemansia sp. RSA 2607]
SVVRLRWALQDRHKRSAERVARWTQRCEGLRRRLRVMELVQGRAYETLCADMTRQCEDMRGVLDDDEVDRLCAGVRDLDAARRTLVVDDYRDLPISDNEDASDDSGSDRLLSVYNKWLFGKSERDFAFPLLVSSSHMLVQYLLATLTLRLFPRLRPQGQLSWPLYLTHAVPCGVASALDIGLSNLSLRTITLTFYTMCKSSALGFVLLFAFLFKLERIRLVLVAIIAIISLGVVLMAAGEVAFVWVGFVEAILSAAMSGLRWALTQILLSQARFGMDNPVATMARLMPIVGASMLLLSVLVERPFTRLSVDKNLQTTRDVLFILLMMFVGGLLAFAMILSEFMLLARTSVVTLSIGGMLKDVLMVSVAHFVFGDTMTPTNAAGLMVALFGIAMYHWLKVHDAVREHARGERDATASLAVAVDGLDYEMLAGVGDTAASARRRMSVRNVGASMVPQDSDARASADESFLAVDHHDATPGPALLKHRE